MNRDCFNNIKKALFTKGNVHLSKKKGHQSHLNRGIYQRCDKGHLLKRKKGMSHNNRGTHQKGKGHLLQRKRALVKVKGVPLRFE